jgi:hypothetical protein
MARQAAQPDFNAFHQSITAELYSTKDRIRNLVSHWPTDGESMEVALRSVLRRHLPASVLIGRGFIVAKEGRSTQIDILVVDASKPTLFREGDLMIVTPDAVRAIVEVKTEVRDRGTLSRALSKLSDVERMCHQVTKSDSVWTGLFSFNEIALSDNIILGALSDAHAHSNRVVNCVSVGTNTFVRFWPEGRRVHSRVPGQVWHSYNLHGVAPSYFMGNLVDAISAVNRDTSSFAWFPHLGGKEQFRTSYLRLGSSRSGRF